MAFGRGRRKEQDAPEDVDGTAGDAVDGVELEEFVDDLDDEDRAYEDAELLAEIDRREREQSRTSFAVTRGPWDLADAPDDPAAPRLDLGALRVPVPPDTEVRVDMSPEGEVVAATLVRGESSLQLNVFAAPRSEGIWAEVREEIREALVAGGGQAEEAQGMHGTELHAAVPTEVPGQGVGLTPARFLGVDGPRWFLRGLLTGPAAVDVAAAEPLMLALADVVVVRGADPMAVRDPLPLHLPSEAQVDAEQAQEPAPDLSLLERGPEITETR